MAGPLPLVNHSVNDAHQPRCFSCFSRSFVRLVTNPITVFSLRIFIGVVFLIAGFGKLPNAWELFIGLPDILRFLKIPEIIWQFIRLEWLPLIEVFIGSCLLIGLFLRPAAAITIILASAFLVFNTAKLFIPYTEWCNCFGTILLIPPPVIEALDILLVLIGFLIIFQKPAKFSVDIQIKRVWPWYNL